jgi:hypothetical protein
MVLITRVSNIISALLLWKKTAPDTAADMPATPVIPDWKPGPEPGTKPIPQ